MLTFAFSHDVVVATGVTHLKQLDKWKIYGTIIFTYLTTQGAALDSNL